MTVNELINNVYFDVGEPTDIDPTDPLNPTGLAWFVTAMNKAMDNVVTWKGYQGRSRSNFKDYITKTYVKNVQGTSTVDDITADGLNIQLTTAPFSIVEGDFLTFGSEARLIYSVAGTEVWIAEAFTSPIYDVGEAEPSTIGVSQTLLAPTTTRQVEYLWVENVQDGEKLDRARKIESNISDLESIGAPTSWRRQGKKIEFDTVPDDVYVWRVWYYRLPTLVTVADYAAMEDFDLPEEFHQACSCFLESLVYRHMQETDESVAAYRRFENLMKTTVGAWERERFLDGGVVFKMGVS